MSVLICDPLESQRLIEERRSTGLDRFDEVMTLRETISLDQAGRLHCETLGITLRFSAGQARPRLLLSGKDGNTLGIV